MSKPYSETDLSHQLVEDRTWRIKEISDLRVIIERADSLSRKVLLRALVTICYAHWEGYVRFAARKYLEHIALRRLFLSDLNRQFTKNIFLARLASLSSKGGFAERCNVIDEILDSSNKRFSRFDQDLINTKSNLNFEVFSEICVVCGIAKDEYTEYEDFINIILLKRRNAIAHGEDTFVGIEDLPVISEKTIELMRAFGDAVENAAVLGDYKAAS